MTIQEFSDGFTTLLNSYSAQASFGNQESSGAIVLDEYEKSLFLTKAQEELVLGLYSGRNPYGEGFESTEELRRYLYPLICESTLSPIVNSGGIPLGGEGGHYFFTLPDGTEDAPNVWFITYESVGVTGTTCKDRTASLLEVVPVKQDEYHRLRKNPFRGVTNRRALRLDLSGGVVEIVSKFKITSYYIRYLRKPKPIVLETLSDGLTIDGEVNAQTSELPDVLHQRILEEAVRMAIECRMGNNGGGERRANKRDT